MESTYPGNVDREVRRSGSGKSSGPRRSVRGPLDIADSPISPQSLTVPRVVSPRQRQSPRSSPISSPSIGSTLESATRAASPGVSQASAIAPSKDFSYLLRPELYHPLTPADLPSAFRNSPYQPSAETSLEDLLSAGHFRAAAILSAHRLTTSTAPKDHAAIFSLLYVRLACLTLSNQTHLAAQEIKALEDLNAAYYRDDLDPSVHLVPWELRVLAIRLQGLGFNDPRRAVTGYYDLARDARLQLSKLKGGVAASTGPGQQAQSQAQSPHDTAAAIAVWESRLHDLGLRVAGALVEMGDLETAARHLSTLRPADNSPVAHSELAFARALLWLRIGDVEAAKAAMAVSVSVADSNAESEAEGGSTSVERINAQIIDALSAMADGDYVSAAEQWGRLCKSSASSSGGEDEPESDGAVAREMAMLQTNYAVALLYAGKMEEAREVLSGLVDKTSFPTLTFNLCTIYELCTEKSRALKLSLAENLAQRPGDGSTSWEKATTDLKL